MLEARNLSAKFGKRLVFEGVSLSLKRSSIYCISGPSGCGKTTLGRIFAGLNRPSKGDVTFDGSKLPSSKRWPVQYLYQSPLSAMNPRWKIRKIIAEAGETDAETARMLGVEAEWDDRYPHELSGGQLQRVSILRALGAKPDFLVADEITSALDPIAQAQIWHLLMGLTQKYELGIVAISHDTSLLSRIGDANNHFRLGV
ncbi:MULTISPECIES: ABC transporter ATP-binding protein [unclassified Ochrobactrum]|uniref:ABC transporter ATP-binding protein n=1 Tax=unclassified Ochrobactrum TaxID=239106 RepID=UPI0030A9D078